MYAGKIVEEGDAQRVFDDPQHPYTIGLLNAIPRKGLRKTDRALFTIPGNLPQIGTPAADVRLRRPLSARRPTSAAPRCRRSSRSATVTSPAATTLDRIGRHARATADDRSRGRHRHRARSSSSTTSRRRSTSAATTSRHWSSVDLGFADGETLGLVGESGSGKSTLAKTMLGVHAHDEGGEISLDGKAMKRRRHRSTRRSRRSMQMVFQNPDSALNRMWSVRRILKRTVVKLTGVKGEAADDRVEELAEAMRLSPTPSRHEAPPALRRTQAAGGHRPCIRRRPRVVVCDEPTSALDVSVQAAILNLLADLQVRERTSYLFITHDIGVVRYLADRIAVMYLGRIMELAPTDAMFDGPEPPVHRGAAVGGAQRRRQRQGPHSASTARSRVPRTRRPGASSTPAATGSSPAPAMSPNLRWSRSGRVTAFAA